VKLETLPVWHKAKENQTPKDIAKLLGVDVKALIAINQKRYPTLAQSSRLRGGTQLRVPRREGDDGLDDVDAWRMDPDVVAYRHWTFPDDPRLEEEPHPSYMMARRLTHRKRGVDGPTSHLLSSGAGRGAARSGSNGGRRGRGEGGGGSSTEVPTSAHWNSAEAASARRVMEATLNEVIACKDETGRSRSDLFLDLPSRKYLPDYYKVIKEPISLRQIEKRIKNTVAARGREGGGATSADVPKYIDTNSGWVYNTDVGFSSFDEFQEEMQRLLDNARTYNLPNSEVYLDAEVMEVFFREAFAKATAGQDPSNLFNKVVALKPAPDGTVLPHPYFYVLTYIPDLQWCRLAPLTAEGKFKGGRDNGQPRWVLVSGEHNEFDVSARRCIQVRSRAAKRTNDADDEEWVIPTDAMANAIGTKEAKDVMAAVRAAASASGDYSHGGRSSPRRAKAAQAKEEESEEESEEEESEEEEEEVDEEDEYEEDEEEDEDSEDSDYDEGRGRGRASLAKKGKAKAVNGAKKRKAAPSPSSSRGRGGTAKRSRSSPRVNGRAADETDESEDSEDEMDEDEDEDEEELSPLEQLLQFPPNSSNPRQVNAWGKSLVGYSVQIPAAVWGHKYARTAKDLWQLSSMMCPVISFLPGKKLKDHRWSFEWTDPESTSSGTLDFVNVSKYARNAVQTQQEEEEAEAAAAAARAKAKAKGKAKGAAKSSSKGSAAKGKAKGKASVKSKANGKAKAAPTARRSPRL